MRQVFFYRESGGYLELVARSGGGRMDVQGMNELGSQVGR